MGLPALTTLPPGGSGSFRLSRPPSSGSLGLLGVSYTSIALALQPPSPTEWHLALVGGGGEKGCTWLLAGMVGRVWRLAESYSQPYSLGVSRVAATPWAFLWATSPPLLSPSTGGLTPNRGGGGCRASAGVVILGIFQALCAVARIAYIYKTLHAFIDDLIKATGN